MEKNLEFEILSLLAARQHDDHVVDENEIAGDLGEDKDAIHYTCSSLAAKDYIYYVEHDGDSWAITKEGALALDTIITANIKEKIDSKTLELQTKSINYQKYGVIIAIITGITAMIVSVFTAMK